MRARAVFNATPQAIREATDSIESELREYGVASARYLDQQNAELRRAMVVLQEVIDTLRQRQSFYARQLEGFAEESSPLRRCIEDMHEETASHVGRMREEMAAAEARMRGIGGTDPGTGLMNRREMDRQIQAHEAGAANFSLILFQVCGPLSDTVMRAAATRLAESFRHSDRAARWSEREFMVLFTGPKENAEERAAQAAASLTKRFTLDNGAPVELTVRTQVTTRCVAAAGQD
jgi:GGDEF domain-containing protein